MSPLSRASLLTLFLAVPLSAQTPAPLPPSITVSTSSDVKVTPDRATIRISVQTRNRTAAAAAAENAKKQSAVLNSLRKLDISNEQLSTSDYNVSPQYRYEQNSDPILTGYIVTNTVVADIHDVTQVGRILDAALQSGANLVSSLEFYASNTATARRQAIANAVTKARAEADAAAKAANGSITGLLELNVGGEMFNPPPRPMYRMAADAVAAPTPISPGQQTLTVSVSARWQFTPSR